MRSTPVALTSAGRSTRVLQVLKLKDMPQPFPGDQGVADIGGMDPVDQPVSGFFAGGRLGKDPVQGDKGGLKLPRQFPDGLDLGAQVFVPVFPGLP